MVSIRSRV
ncbi:hypothetical protein YPPY06_1547, partial [Yersinia pestis PY-06]